MKFGGARFSRLIALCIALILLLSLFSCMLEGEAGEYTYRSYTSALGTNWSPHTWETSQDRAIMGYLTSPLVSVLPLNTDEGTYQWSFDMAKSVTDVTGHATSDLIRFNCELPIGVSADDVSEGYVFEIALRDGLAFEGGREIDADEFIESMKLLLDPKMKNSRANLYITGESAIAGGKEYFSGDGAFSDVGLYKTGEMSFRYVTKSYIDYNYFLASLSSHWLVDTEEYKRGMSESGGISSTAYNTSLDTTSSFGPYRISAHQSEKELVLVRNESWFGWHKDESGKLFSLTDYLVDGERKRQYMTTKVVISVVDNNTAKQYFTRGELSEWAPSASEYKTYRFSDGLYRTDETYTMSLFFNTDKDALLSMDRARGNTNSVVLTSESFRHAISLAIDRDELSLATEGYDPQFALLNNMYYYDIYNDPDSSYRGSDAAKAAVCRLYGAAWGEGAPYATLDEAYSSITGYDPSGARELFKAAHDELVGEGLYREGEDVRIRVAWAKGALSADDNQQIALINKYINNSARGTGFGKITLEPVARVANRYAAVPAGEYAIGYGAWGGAAFYPFRTLLVYMDPEYESLHEGACWSPDKEVLTLSVGGVEKSMTWQAWARSMTGTGEYSKASAELKLEICTKLEEAFLARYYRIPLLSSSASVLLSYQVSNYTDSYNLMYGFGGFRLLEYHFDDKEWSEYVRSAGGRLRYE